MTENTVNTELCDEDLAEQWLIGRASDVSFLLAEKDIEHETYVNSDGDEGWHLVITAGHAVHGSPLREYTVTYVSAEDRWIYQSTAEDGEDVGPHALTGLLGDASAVEIAEHIAVEVER